MWNLGKTAIRTRLHALLGLLAAAAFALGVHELAVLLGAGLLALAAQARVKPPALALAAAPLPPGLGAILLVFLKLGAVVSAADMSCSLSCERTSSPVCTG